MNIQKLYSLLQTNTKKKKKNYPIKEHFTSKLCLTIFDGIKIAIQKSEPKKNLKYPCAYQHTHTHINTYKVAEERNKNNTNGKIIMMIDKRERKENALAYSPL